MQLLCTFVFDLSIDVLSFEKIVHNKNPRLLATREAEAGGYLSSIPAWSTK